MDIVLNDQPTVISNQSTVQQLINDLLGEKQKGIAIAINNSVIPQITWRDYLIRPDDNILIIKATPGG